MVIISTNFRDLFCMISWSCIIWFETILSCMFLFTWKKRMSLSFSLQFPMLFLRVAILCKMYVSSYTARIYFYRRKYPSVWSSNEKLSSVFWIGFIPPSMASFWNCWWLEAILYNSLNKDISLSAKNSTWAGRGSCLQGGGGWGRRALTSLVKSCSMLLSSVCQCDVSLQFKMLLQAKVFSSFFLIYAILT